MTAFQTVLAIIVSIITIISSLAGLVIYLNKKVEARINDLRNNIKKDIQEDLRPEIQEVNKSVQNLKEDMNEIIELRKNDEVDRLKDYILLFSAFVKVVPRDKVSDHLFANIFADYAKYNNLGGNSYIDEEMKYVKKIYREIKEEKRNG